MPVGLPGLAAACFILGVLLYSTVVRAEYPDIGSTSPGSTVRHYGVLDWREDA